MDEGRGIDTLEQVESSLFHGQRVRVEVLWQHHPVLWQHQRVLLSKLGNHEAMKVLQFVVACSCLLVGTSAARHPLAKSGRHGLGRHSNPKSSLHGRSLPWPARGVASSRREASGGGGDLSIDTSVDPVLLQLRGGAANPLVHHMRAPTLPPSTHARTRHPRTHARAHMHAHICTRARTHTR